MSMNFWRTTVVIIVAVTTGINLFVGPNWFGMVSMWFCGAALSSAIIGIMVSSMRTAFNEMYVAYTMMKECNDAIIKMHIESDDAPTISPDRGIDKRLH